MMEAGAIAEMFFLDWLKEAGCVGIIFAVVMLFLMKEQLAEMRLAKRRRQELTAWMQARRLTFRYDCDSRITEHFELPCYHQTCNIYEGVCNGHGILAFDYNCGDLRSCKRLDSRVGSSGLIVTTDMQMKPLLIEPMTHRQGIPDFLERGDIDFESAEFSREFYVKSPDKRWAYDVVNPSTMELLLASPRFNLEFAGTSVIAYNRCRLEASHFEAALTLIEGILQRLPPSLVHELQAGGQNA